MKDTSTGQATRPESGQERLDRLLAEARGNQELTNCPGWVHFFGGLQQEANDAARELLTVDDMESVIRCQVTIAYARRQVARLRKPFEDLNQMRAGHPLAAQDLPCAVAFDESMARSFMAPIEGDWESASCPQPLEAAPERRDLDALDEEAARQAGAWDWMLDPVDGDSNEGVAQMDRCPDGRPAKSVEQRDSPSTSMPTPAPRKFKHPWKAEVVGKR